MADETKTEATEPVKETVKEPVKENAELPQKKSPVKPENATNGSASTENGESEKDLESLKKQATLLFLQGKRHLIIRDYQLAVEALSDACQMFSKVYSEQADEMADPYFYYGRALFEIARNESEVLGDQVAKDEDKNDDDDDDDEIPEEDENNEDGEKEEEKIENGDEKIENDNNVEAEAEAGGSQTEEGENEAVNDLQLSWEYLELAKLIYKKKADTCKETAIKLAEVYLYLGENGLESESYGTAVEDMKEGLALLQKNLPPEDRRIAEMFYQLGMAYSLSENFDEAITCFQSAITHLEKKIESLQKRIETGDKKTEDEERDAFYTMEGEIDEIKSIINDVKEKITDMNDYKKQVKAELIKQVFSGGSSGSAGPSSSASSVLSSGEGSSSSSATTIPPKAAMDISHLIRKKRKNEDEEANPEKKTKVDDEGKK